MAPQGSYGGGDAFLRGIEAASANNSVMNTFASLAANAAMERARAERAEQVRQDEKMREDIRAAEAKAWAEKQFAQQIAESEADRQLTKGQMAQQLKIAQMQAAQAETAELFDQASRIMKPRLVYDPTTGTDRAETAAEINARVKLDGYDKTIMQELAKRRGWKFDDMINSMVASSGAASGQGKDQYGPTAPVDKQTRVNLPEEWNYEKFQRELAAKGDKANTFLTELPVLGAPIETFSKGLFGWSPTGKEPRKFDYNITDKYNDVLRGLDMQRAFRASPGYVSSTPESTPILSVPLDNSPAKWGADIEAEKAREAQIPLSELKRKQAEILRQLQESFDRLQSPTVTLVPGA